MKPFRPTIVIALVLAGVARPMVPARAEDPVWDPEEIARLAEKSAQMADALSRTVEIVGGLEGLSLAMGRPGRVPNLDFAYPATAEGLQAAGPMPGPLVQGVAGIGPVNIDSLPNAAAFVARLVATPAGQDRATKAAQVTRALGALHRNALEDGYALALHMRDSLSLAPSRARLLVAQASSSNDLRGDTAANTAVALAVLDQLASLKAMLALILEIETTGTLRNTRSGPGASP